MRKNGVHKRAALIALTLLLAVISIAVVKTSGQEDKVVMEQWEYLAVAGPSTTNLTATGNPRMRKEPNVSFGRGAFVLEQHPGQARRKWLRAYCRRGTANGSGLLFQAPEDESGVWLTGSCNPEKS